MALTVTIGATIPVSIENWHGSQPIVRVFFKKRYFCTLFTDISRFSRFLPNRKRIFFQCMNFQSFLNEKISNNFPTTTFPLFPPEINHIFSFHLQIKFIHHWFVYLITMHRAILRRGDILTRIKGRRRGTRVWQSLNSQYDIHILNRLYDLIALKRFWSSNFSSLRSTSNWSTSHTHTHTPKTESKTCVPAKKGIMKTHKIAIKQYHSIGYCVECCSP